MILGKIPLDEITEGMRVKSGYTGNLGTIKEVTYGKVDIDKIGWIIIRWDHGGISSHPFYDPDYNEQAFDKILIHVPSLGETYVND